jgi:hypothetical protein
MNGKHDKLKKIYMEGKYEKCLYKADNYTYKDEYKKDPEPYLYISMCFYQLSVSEDEGIREDYKDGFKQAINYARKFLKKDKEGNMISDNIDYIEMLKREQINNIQKYLKIDDFGKAKLQANVYSKLNKEDDFALEYYIGMLETLKGSSNGERVMNKAQEELLPKLDDGSYKHDPIIKSLIKNGFLKYSEIMVGEGQNAKAKEAIKVGHKLFPNDGYITMQYNMMNKK